MFKIILSLSLSFFLVACNSSSTSEEPSNNQPQKAKTERARRIEKLNEKF
jgi:hypothetical protein